MGKGCNFGGGWGSIEADVGERNPETQEKKNLSTLNTHDRSGLAAYHSVLEKSL